MNAATLFSAFIDLSAKGWVVLPEFLPAQTCLELRREIETFESQKILAAAGVGRGLSRRVAEEVRADRIHWLEPTSLSVAQRLLWNALEGLRVELNRNLFLGLKWYEAHLTAYPEGAFYHKHVDCFSRTADRKLSCVLYLNPNWCKADGGSLRLYKGEDPDLIETDIVPELGTLAVFLSAGTLHEVLPTNRTRYSVTIWFRQDCPIGLGPELQELLEPPPPHKLIRTSR